CHGWPLDSAAATDRPALRDDLEDAEAGLCLCLGTARDSSQNHFELATATVSDVDQRNAIHDRKADRVYGIGSVLPPGGRVPGLRQTTRCLGADCVDGFHRARLTDRR